VLVRCGSLVSQVASTILQVSLLSARAIGIIPAAVAHGQQQQYQQLVILGVDVELQRLTFEANLVTRVFSAQQHAVARVSQGHVTSAPRALPQYQDRTSVSASQLAQYCNWQSATFQPNCTVSLACPAWATAANASSIPSQASFSLLVTNAATVHVTLEYRSTHRTSTRTFQAQPVPLGHSLHRNGKFDAMAHIVLLEPDQLRWCQQLQIDITRTEHSASMVLAAEFFRPRITRLSFAGIGVFGHETFAVTNTDRNAARGTERATMAQPHSLLMHVQISGVSDKHYPFAMRLKHRQQDAPLFSPLAILRAPTYRHDSLSVQHEDLWSLCSDALFIPELNANYFYPLRRHFVPHHSVSYDTTSKLPHGYDTQSAATQLLEDTIDIVLLTDPFTDFEVCNDTTTERERERERVSERLTD
jgi:hypothetical protein